MRKTENMGKISCNQSRSRDTLGFTCGMEDLRARGSVTYFKVSLLMLERDQLVP